MESSRALLSDDERRDIFALGHRIERHIAESWQAILQTKHDRLLEVFEKAGDAAYGTYGTLLFRPVRRQLEQAGLRASPRLPGDFEISREWGNADESDQQRWMWSTIKTAAGEPLGTIVTLFHHDHTRFRVPRQPGIIALREIDKAAVEAELSRRSPSSSGLAEPSSADSGLVRPARVARRPRASLR